jgi:orotidine-5'-phosphate decarboxylase
MEVKERIIVAMDLDDLDEVKSLVRTLLPHVGFFKVGHQLFTRYGPEAVKTIHAEGGRVFLDLKYHDIPNTVRGAVESATSLGVAMVNVHASGGTAMMKAAVTAAQAAASTHAAAPPILLGVTILTSLVDNDLEEVGIAPPVMMAVRRLAALAHAAGMGGVVASPHEVAIIREVVPLHFVIVTPGVRFEDSKADDQKRTLGPREALLRGADYLVIGRPILAARRPVEAAQRIADDMAAAFS